MARKRFAEKGMGVPSSPCGLRRDKSGEGKKTLSSKVVFSLPPRHTNTPLFYATVAMFCQLARVLLVICQ